MNYRRAGLGCQGTFAGVTLDEGVSRDVHEPVGVKCSLAFPGQKEGCFRGVVVVLGFVQNVKGVAGFVVPVSAAAKPAETADVVVFSERDGSGELDFHASTIISNFVTPHPLHQHRA